MNRYIEASFAELFENDGLTVMGRGLGIDLLFCKFIQYFSKNVPTTTASKPQSSITAVVPAISSPRLQRLVLCINVNGQEEAMCDLLLHEGASPNQLPKIINNECNATDRLDMYNEGGCFFITSRILIVDMLDGKLDANRITGLLIYDAHRISETSIESFIIRVFREKNKIGFIKAFSEDPEAFQSGFAKVERLMKVLFLTKLYLWPRFRSEISRALECRITPEVIELSISLTNNMKMIQNAVLVAMNTCVTELKKSCPNLDATNLTLENGLFHSFDILIRNQLDPEWHKISYRTKQIVNDIGTLRKLLDYLIRYDAFSFYYLLLKLQTASSEQQFPSLWLTSEAANRIFMHAKERVFRIVNSTNSCSWMKSSAMIDGRVGEILSFLNLEQVMEPVLECPPKWKLLTQIVKEIKGNFTKTYKKPYDRSDDPSRSPDDEVANMILSTHGRVVVVVKDELAISQLRDVLAHGPEYVMDQRFRWFVSQQSAFIRKKHNRSNLSSKSTGSVRVAKYSGSRKSTTSSSSGLDGLDLQNDQSINLTDKVIHQMLSEEGTTSIDRHLDEENMVASASDDRPGFFGLGLTEGDLRVLNKEMQLMLLQEKILRLSPPAQSVQEMSTDFQSTIPLSSSSKCIDLLRKQSSIQSSIADPQEKEPEPLFFQNKRRKIESVSSLDDDVQLKGSFLDPDLFISLVTHNQLKENMSKLRELQPRYIILYDADVHIVRNIEALQSLPNIEKMTVYFLAYESSAEEHRYVGSLAKEKKAFEFLIRTKEHLVVSLPYQNESIERSVASGNIVVDSRNSLKNSKGKIGPTDLRKVVVDVREFRSTLPSILYMNSFQLVPRTIAVGDYVLSSEICVERKGISDLFQSFSSGRLYNQAESMSRYYKYPCLLIEFSPDKAFCFMAPNEITTEIQASAIQSKIVLLAQSFPNLKIFWSRSASHTSEIFKTVVTNHEEVDVNKAITVGAVLDAQGNSVHEGISEEVALAEQEQDARSTAHAILMSLPGINVHNFREITNKVDNLAELSKMTEAELAPLIGPGNAKKMSAFFRQRVM